MKFSRLVKNPGRTHLLIFGFLLSVYLLSFLPHDALISVTQEDGPVEYLTAIGFLIASIMFLCLFARSRNFKDPEDQKTYKHFSRRSFFLLMAMVLFFGFGEEISWGQRIFGFGTPEIMLEHNVQDEFNIHNLKVFNLSEVRGGAIRKEGWETLFTMKRLFVLSFLLYLLVIPLLSKFSEKIRRLLQSLYIPIPWIWLGIYFVANVFMYRLFKGIAKYQGFENHGISELEELNFSFLLVLLPLLWINLPGPAFFKKGRTGKRKSAYIKAD